MIIEYRFPRDSGKQVSRNFMADEFRSKDGTEVMKLDTKLVELLQNIRDHFGVAVTINSGYRSAAHNKKVGGAYNSQHLQGTAADIVVKGIDPIKVAQYAEHLHFGGIGLYNTFVHVDTRAFKTRWANDGKNEVNVPGGFPGYVDPHTPPVGYTSIVFVDQEGKETVMYGVMKENRSYAPVRELGEKLGLAIDFKNGIVYMNEAPVVKVQISPIIEKTTSPATITNGKAKTKVKKNG